MESSTESKQRSVVFSNNDLLSIQKKTNVNGINIYQVDMGDCLRYISINTKYIGIIYQEALYIFNLIDDGDFTDDFKTKFAEMDNRHISILKQKIINTYIPEATVLRRIINWFKQIPNFSYVTIEECPEVINLTNANNKLTYLNNKLHERCPGFKLKIDYVFNFTDTSIVTAYAKHTSPHDLLLCLMNDNNCVSSLTLQLDFENRTIMFDSRTNKQFEQRKFNKLLRAVIIIIAKKIDKHIQFITSNANNPISAHLMIKSFNAEPFDTRSDISVTHASTFGEMQTAIEREETITSTVDLSRENINNAKTVFNDTIHKINCTANNDDALTATGGKRTNKTRRKHTQVKHTNKTHKTRRKHTNTSKTHKHK